MMTRRLLMFSQFPHIQNGVSTGFRAKDGPEDSQMIYLPLQEIHLSILT
jgi:hypothetical protein